MKFRLARRSKSQIERSDRSWAHLLLQKCTIQDIVLGPDRLTTNAPTLVERNLNPGNAFHLNAAAGSMCTMQTTIEENQLK